MKKTKVSKEPKERKDLTAKAFMNIVADNFIINTIFFGFFLGILQVVAKEYLNGIVLAIATLAIIYIAIKKIFVDAVKETFYEGRIMKNEINKVVHSFTKIFATLTVVTIAWNIYSFVTGYNQAVLANIKNLYIVTLLIGIVFTILTYVVLMFVCRKNFFELCKNPENVVEG